ncbi:aminotransferase class IV [Intrasporangium sp.]|uniref:aminotransferase class IV n=1 Tax=Intrasporangium sp. TaxID=1925024 RepID=UPI0032216AEB
MSGEIRVWVNGRLVEPDTPALAALDHGVTVGDGVFETVKIEHGRTFALRRHHERLLRSAAGLGLPDIDLDLLGEGIAAVLEGTDIDLGRLRYSVTGGAGPLGSDRLPSAPTYIVLAGPQPRPPDSGAVVVVPWTRNERSAVAGLKTTSYAENVIALEYAQQRGGVEAVFANTRGELCECTGSNIFVVRAGEVLTPPVEAGLLPGITRGLTIEWAGVSGIPVQETALPLRVLDEADEVFITSTTKDILAVHAVDGRALPGDRPVTTRLQQVFRENAAGNPDP